MGGEVYYLIAEVISIFVLMLFAACTLISMPRNLNAWLVTLYCLSGISSRLFNMSFKTHLSFDWGLHWLPTQLIINLGPGLLVLLCFSLFHDTGRRVGLNKQGNAQIFRRFPLWFLTLYALQMGLSMFRTHFVPNDLSKIDVTSIGEANFFIFGQLPQLLQAGFGVIALVLIIQGWREDMVESRRVLRGIALAWFSIVSLSGGLGYAYIVTASASHVAIMYQYNMFVSMFVYTGIALLVFRIDSSAFESLAAPAPQQDLMSKQEDQFEQSRFDKIFRDQRSYLEPGLSVADLAKKLAIPQYKLRALINKKLGYRNFNALLNEYRVKDACTQLADPEQNSLPILTIALSVGYQSIAPFNLAFRDITGLTPSAYRKQSRLSGHPTG